MRSTRRRWRRVSIRLVAIVVLATATTIGVAWAEALRQDPAAAVYTGAWGGGFKLPAINTNPAYNWPQGPPAGAVTREMTIFTIDAFGWPRPALLREIEWTYLLSVQHAWQGVTAYRARSGFRVPISIGTLTTPDETVPLRRVLPAKIMWRGFATNTAIFAAGWGALFIIAWAPGMLRRRRRARLGLCGGCGYDLRHSVGVCPECGRAIDAGSKEGAPCRSDNSSSSSP